MCSTKCIIQANNLYETDINVVHKPGHVITELGRKRVWSLKGKTHTILTCVSASGQVLPPMMIYPTSARMIVLKMVQIPVPYLLVLTVSGLIKICT